MFHAHTDRVLDEWRRRRGPARLPARTQLSPILFGPLLPQMFVLADDGEAGWRFRLAGAFLGELFARELSGEAYAGLWTAGDRASAVRALQAARRAEEPAVLGCRGDSPSGRFVAMELLLAPVTGPTEAPDRVVGLLQPVSAVARLGGEPVSALRLTDLRSGSPRPLPGPRLVVDNTRA